MYHLQDPLPTPQFSAVAYQAIRGRLTVINASAIIQVSLKDCYIKEYIGKSMVIEE